MNALAFMKKHGREVASQVAKGAGSSIEYFSQIAYGHRRPSVPLAERLVEESAKRFPDPEEQLDFVALMKSKEARAA